MGGTFANRREGPNFRMDPFGVFKQNGKCRGVGILTRLIWLIFGYGSSVYDIWQLNFGVANKVSRWNAPYPHGPTKNPNTASASLSRSRSFLWSGLLDRNQKQGAQHGSTMGDRLWSSRSSVVFERQMVGIATFSRGGKACSPGPHGPVRRKWLQWMSHKDRHQKYGDESRSMDRWHLCWSSF